MSGPSVFSRIAGIDVLMERIDGFERRANERLDAQDRVAEQTLEQAKQTNGRMTRAERKLDEIEGRHQREDENIKRRQSEGFTWRQGFTVAGFSAVVMFAMYELLSLHLIR